MTKFSIAGDGIVCADSGVDGPRVGILCNVHGNEPCGRTAVLRVLASTELARGSLVIIDGNPEAALVNRRSIETDMNRLFTERTLSTESPTNDLRRARYLAATLPTLGLDYALDLHSTSGQSKFPFAVGFDGSEKLAPLCPVPRVIFGWEGYMSGTLVEWLTREGVPTITVEGGQHTSDRALRVAEQTIISALCASQLVKEIESPALPLQHIYRVIQHVTIDDGPSFRFSRSYESFDKISANEVIAYDGVHECRALDETGLEILMPGDQQTINAGLLSDAYYLIKSSAD